MNTKILINLGKQLKKIRKEKGFTQELLAEKVGIHPTYVGKLESGKNNVSIKMLFKISRALKIKLSDVFEFDK
jgi:transcriptional regulator with XRE-family HTH domain